MGPGMVATHVSNPSRSSKITIPSHDPHFAPIDLFIICTHQRLLADEPDAPQLRRGLLHEEDVRPQHPAVRTKHALRSLAARC